MNFTNLLGLPDAFVAAVRNDSYTGGGDISVTRLIDSPQKRVLYKKFKEFVVEDVSDRVWSLMGQCMHTLLERAATSAKVEERLYMDVNGWSLSGQFDRLHVADKCLQDWKVTTCYKAKGDEAWERQLNILRALAIHNGYDVQKLQVIAILRDWRRAEALRSPDYPQQNVVIIDVPVWDLEDTHAYIKERIALHQKAEEDSSIGCTDDERWYAGSTYALMKIGGKRATKVAPSREELGDPPEGSEIIERRGGYRRCESFCEVAPFCQQWKAEQEKVNGTNVEH